MGFDCTFYNPATGAIDMVCELSQETLRHYAESDAAFLVLTAGDKEAQYVVDGALVDFSPEELAAKRGMAPGWIWLMPDRRAVDMRTVDDARATKIADMSDACAAAILRGFTSDALGAEFTYPLKLTDQANLSNSILDSLLPGLPSNWTTPFWCANTEGVWAMRPHSAAQIQRAGRDGKTAILAAMTKNEGLRTQIMASSIAQIDLIHW